MKYREKGERVKEQKKKKKNKQTEWNMIINSVNWINVDYKCILKIPTMGLRNKPLQNGWHSSEMEQNFCKNTFPKAHSYLRKIYLQYKHDTHMYVCIPKLNEWNLSEIERDREQVNEYIYIRLYREKKWNGKRDEK